MKIAVVCKDQKDFWNHEKDSDNKYEMICQDWMIGEGYDKIELTKWIQRIREVKLLDICLNRLKKPILIEPNTKEKTTIWFNELTHYKKGELEKIILGMKQEPRRTLTNEQIKQLTFTESNPIRGKSWMYELFNEYSSHTKEQLENLKKPDKMKITEETKLKDLIPEGYELPEDWQYDFDFKIDLSSGIHIPIKKKEVKDFSWYFQKYLQTPSGITLNELVTIKQDFVLGTYNASIPFEVKIGLLKFICDDINLNWRGVIEYDKGCIERISKICPKEFLDSIFK